jgi:peptidoglycan L-alanyl-D-glutamate endopeptidase CwlK
MIDRRVDILLPEFKARLERAVREAQKAGHQIAVFETWRTPTRQDELYNQGRTAPGKKVTNARGWDSWHQYGVAADIAGMANSKWTWGQEVDFTAAMKFFKAEGLETLDPFEQCHVQLTHGLTIAEAKLIQSRLGLLGVWAEILRR